MRGDDRTSVSRDPAAGTIHRRGAHGPPDRMRRGADATATADREGPAIR